MGGSGGGKERKKDLLSPVGTAAGLDGIPPGPRRIHRRAGLAAAAAARRDSPARAIESPAAGDRRPRVRGRFARGERLVRALPSSGRW